MGVFGGFSRGSLGDLWLLDLSFRNSDDFHDLRRAISSGEVDEKDIVIKQMSIGLDGNSNRNEVLNFLQSVGAVGEGAQIEEETLAMMMITMTTMEIVKMMTMKVIMMQIPCDET